MAGSMVYKRISNFLLPNVESIMSSPVETIPNNTPLIDAIDLMIEKKVGSLVVMGEGKPVGIFTRRDLFNRALKKRISLTDATVEAIMSSPVVTVSPEDKVDSMIRIMNEKQVTRAVVMEHSQLVGILTETDIRLRLPRHLQSHKSVLKRYIIDTLAYIIFWSGITIVIQLFVVGISFEKFVASSLLGFIVTICLSGIFGRFLDMIRNLFNV